MTYKPMIAATALVVASCGFSAASAAPAKGVRSAPVTAAAQADTPYAAWVRRDVPALTGMAETGDAIAQFNLGLLYDNGEGVPQDYAAAAGWYRKAADQGNASAQYNLGLLYATGRGVAQDYAAAVSWFRKAADQGNASAQFNLGVSYYKGQGVPQDYAAAASWYRKAADQGSALGQANLGVSYYNGEGVAQDYVQAHKWFNLGATSGDADAVKIRDLVASMMTPAQIAEAQRLASAWRKK